MKKIKISYIISHINKALAFEWVCTYLDKDKFDLHFILLNPEDSELENFIRKNNVAVDRIRYTGKKDVPRAIWNTYKILKKRKSEIVHAHLFDASIVGMIAAWMAGIKKRIYTRHHSTYHHTYFPKAIKYDRLVNFLSTDIVAISDLVKNVLINQEKASEKKIIVIHHGFQLNNFRNVSESSINGLRQKYAPLHSTPVVGVISRHMQMKGIQYIIPAFEKLLITYPNAILILANAKGDYKDEIKKLLQKIPSKNYTEIIFENDLYSLYKLFDIFIHVPINPDIEAFGQTYVEALAAGVPSIFTLSGVATEFITHRQNALVVPFKNTEAIYNSMVELIENKPLQTTLITNGEKDVFSKFNLPKMILSLEQLYAK